MMRKLTLAAAIALMAVSTTTAANLRGAEKDQAVDAPEHRMLPPLSRGWAYGGAAGSRKDIEGAQGEENQKAAETHEPEHRMLPPLSRGWAYGGAAGSRKDVEGTQEKEKAAETNEPAHRMLPPLSRGWAYGGAEGSRKEETNTEAEEEAKAVAAPQLPLKQQGVAPALVADEAAKEPVHRALPPLSRGWAYGGAAGSRKEETNTEGEADKQEAKPAN